MASQGAVERQFKGRCSGNSHMYSGQGEKNSGLWINSLVNYCSICLSFSPKEELKECDCRRSISAMTGTHPGCGRSELKPGLG